MDKKWSNINLLKIRIKDGYIFWRGKNAKKKKKDHDNKGVGKKVNIG